MTRRRRTGAHLLPAAGATGLLAVVLVAPNGVELVRVERIGWRALVGHRVSKP